jgi:aspartyl-tRNA(Asn)/glutamyl-tRNA(Gln) amidotransferase subunit B
VCLGLPGALPVLNRAAYEWGLKLAQAFGCRIAPQMKFDRKQYFYPDLPKGYQISQYGQPLAERGHLDIIVNGATRRIGLTRIHMEEDAGKLLHDPNQPSSYVDLNRAGVPLLEIVSEPDLRSSEEAFQYLTELKAIVKYVGVSSCDMEKGSLRCDANISLRPAGAAQLGAKVEIKNLNSFKAVKAALEYETRRQAEALSGGQRIAQETRLWNARAEATESMRSKEEASDYRYFPEPDLVPCVTEEALVDRLRKELPELPSARRARLAGQYGLSAYDADVLTQHPRIAGLFEEAVTAYPEPKPVANWIMGELLAYLNANGIEPDALTFQSVWLAHLLGAVKDGTITGKAAKDVFVESLKTQRDPLAIIEERDLKQIVDGDWLDRLAEDVLAANQKSIEDYRKGKANALMFLVGECMKQSRGKANPAQVTELLKRKLDGT